MIGWGGTQPNMGGGQIGRGSNNPVKGGGKTRGRAHFYAFPSRLEAKVFV